MWLLLLHLLLGNRDKLLNDRGRGPAWGLLLNHRLHLHLLLLLLLLLSKVWNRVD